MKFTNEQITARVRTLKAYRAMSTLGNWRSWESQADSAIWCMRNIPEVVRSPFLDLLAIQSIIDETPWLYHDLREKMKGYLFEAVGLYAKSITRHYAEMHGWDYEAGLEREREAVGVDDV